MSSRALTVEGYVVRPGSARGTAMLVKSTARQRGWRVARVVEESDGSNRLEEMLLRIESGESDGLIVARLADLGASLPQAVAAIERIKAAGGTLLSINDRIELGPRTGALIWRLLVGLADC